jgi:hypothetical protein
MIECKTLLQQPLNKTASFGSRKSVFVTGFWSTYGYNDIPWGMLRALERNFGQSIAPSGYCGSDYWENAQDQDSLCRSASGQDHSVSSG